MPLPLPLLSTSDIHLSISIYLPSHRHLFSFWQQYPIDRCVPKMIKKMFLLPKLPSYLVWPMFFHLLVKEKLGQISFKKLLLLLEGLWSREIWVSEIRPLYTIIASLHQINIPWIVLHFVTKNTICRKKLLLGEELKQGEVVWFN